MPISGRAREGALLQKSSSSLSCLLAGLGVRLGGRLSLRSVRASLRSINSETNEQKPPDTLTSTHAQTNKRRLSLSPREHLSSRDLFVGRHSAWQKSMCACVLPSLKRTFPVLGLAGRWLPSSDWPRRRTLEAKGQKPGRRKRNLGEQKTDGD